MDDYFYTLYNHPFSPVFIRSRTIQFSLGKYCSRHHILINTHMYIAYQYTTRNPTANPHITTSLLLQKSVLLRLSNINTALTTTALSPPPFSPTSASFFTPLRLFLSNQVHFSQPPLLPLSASPPRFITPAWPQS